MRHNDCKSRIMEAAEILFSQKGFNAVSIREISSEAGVNISMINYYFKSKENLLRSILDQALLLFTELAEELGHFNEMPEAQMRHYITFVTAVLFENTTLVYILIQEFSIASKLRFSIKRSLYRLREILFENFSHVIDNGISKNVFSSDVDKQLLFHSYLGLACMILLENGKASLGKNSNSKIEKTSLIRIRLENFTAKLILNNVVGDKAMHNE